MSKVSLILEGIRDRRLVSESKTIFYKDRDKSFSSVKDKEVFYYSSENCPENYIFKGNGLGNVIYRLSCVLEVGDVIEITADGNTWDKRNKYSVYILITVKYDNGNRGYVDISPKYDSEAYIFKQIEKGRSSRWRDITDSSAWLDFSDRIYKLTILKNKYKLENVKEV